MGGLNLGPVVGRVGEVVGMLMVGNPMGVLRGFYLAVHIQVAGELSLEILVSQMSMGLMLGVLGDRKQVKVINLPTSTHSLNWANAQALLTLGVADLR